MRILFLSAWLPLPADNGVKLRISHLLRGLGQQHDVDLLSFAPDEPSKEVLQELHTFCRSVEIIPENPFTSTKLGRVRGFLSSKPSFVIANYNERMATAVRSRSHIAYDLVFASEIHTVPYALLLQGIPRILDGLEMTGIYEYFTGQKQPLARLRYTLTWWKMRAYIQSILRSFDGLSIVSENERAFLERFTSPQTRLVVIPNGVDTTACSGDFGAPENGVLIYPGALSYGANFDAVAYFGSEILPRIRAKFPAARLRVTGRQDQARIAALPTTDGIEFTGFLDDIRPSVARAWAEVVPLREGSGTRLKVLEAMALGTPVISTSKGIEGLDVTPGRDVLVADTSEAFIDQTLRLLGSPSLRHDLAEQGHRTALRYDWRHSTDRLNDLVLTCVHPLKQESGSLSTAVRSQLFEPTARSGADVEEIVR
jgi:glycosyltransferase involved in cell wall biosynthesis